MHISPQAPIVEAFGGVPEARGQTALILCIGEEGRPGHPVRNPANLLRRIADIVEVEAYSRSRVIAHGRPSGHVALEQARRLISSGETSYIMIVGVDSYLTSETIRHYVGENRILRRKIQMGSSQAKRPPRSCCRNGVAGLYS